MPNRDYMAFLDAQRREAAQRHDAAREVFAAQLSGVNDDDPGSDWSSYVDQERARRDREAQEKAEETAQVAREADEKLAQEGDLNAYLRLLGLAGE